MKHLNQTLSANSSAHPQDVVATKLFLRHQGHYTPPEWGISQFPDRSMFDAIKAFQKSQGLKVDGVMNPEGETETAIKAEAQKLQSLGRNGDTILAHITPAEAQLLNDVTDGGSINPDTGLPEFFIGDFFSGLSDSFSSIGTSLSDSFSSIGDSFSSGLSDIGTSVSSNLDSTFGKGFSDQVGSFAGGLTSRVASKYVSQKIGKKVGGPLGDVLGDTIGGAVGNTLGDTVSGAFQPSQNLGANMTDSLKPSASAQSNSPSSLSSPTRSMASSTTSTRSKPAQNLGVVGNGLGMQSHGLGMSSHGLGMGEKPQPKPQPPAPKPEPLPSLKGLSQQLSPQPKPVSPAALKSVIADFKAKQQQGGVQNLLQNGPTQNANAKPIGTADINTNQLGHLKPLGTPPALTPEASASNARLAAASAKTTDHSLLKRDVTDALKTGGAQAQAEVQDLTQQMNDLQPGSGTKLAQEVGLNTPTHPGFPPRKPEPPAQVPLSLDEQNKLINGEPYKFQAAKGIDGQKLPPPIVSPTESGKIRKPDDYGGGQYQASRDNGSDLHRGLDFATKPDEDIKSSVSGTVVNVEADPYGGTDYRIVDIKTDDGYIVRHFYVSPTLKKGASVKAGKTIIGKSQDIASKFNKNGKAMTNHVHVEIREPLIEAYPKNKTRLTRQKDINPEKALMRKK